MLQVAGAGGESAPDMLETIKPDVILVEPVGSRTDVMATVVRPREIGRAGGSDEHLAPLFVRVRRIDPASFLFRRADGSYRCFTFRVGAFFAQAASLPIMVSMGCLMLEGSVAIKPGEGTFSAAQLAILSKNDYDFQTV